MGLIAQAADETATADGELNPHVQRAEVQNLLFFGPQAPVFLQVRVRIDGVGFRAAIADRLFRAFDRDANDHLDKNERQLLLAPENAELVPGLSEVSWDDVDTEPSNGLISRSEFVRYVVTTLESPFVVAEKPKSPANSVKLFSRLDRNEDGRLSNAELTGSRRMLAKLDLDDDETYSAAELLPFRDPLAAGVLPDLATDATGLEFVKLGTGRSVSSVVEKLMKRYGDGPEDIQDRRISSETLGLESQALAEFDADSDGALNVSELTRFVQNPVPHAKLTVELAAVRRRRSSLTVSTQKRALVTNFVTEVEKVRGDRWTLNLAGASIEVRAKSSQAATFDNRQFYKLRFRVADRDKNKYLDQEEFAGVGLQNADFKMVDGDGDGQVFEKELIAHVDRAALSDQSRIVMTVGTEGKSLFEVLDVNSDRRISLREFNTAYDRVMPFDQNRDGLLAKSELTQRYRLTFEAGKPRLFQTSAVMVRAAPTEPIISEVLSGPVWFQKMDRNRDGDVSEREFLGSREAFRRLDGNGDRLISAAEAEKGATSKGTPNK